MNDNPVQWAIKNDEDVAKLLARLARGYVANWKVETLAKRAREAGGVAGRAVPWEGDGEIVSGVMWDERGRERYRGFAREILERAIREQ